ncbi:MAG: hypothetical protein ABIL16_01870 [candidate division WOR-3 bacterium]
MAIFYTEDTKIAIEIDIRAKVKNDTDYIIQKTNDLLRFGVKRVI